MPATIDEEAGVEPCCSETETASRSSLSRSLLRGSAVISPNARRGLGFRSGSTARTSVAICWPDQIPFATASTYHSPRLRTGLCVPGHILRLRSVQVAFLFEAPSTVPSALGAMRRRRTDSAKINGLMPVSSGGRGTSWRPRPTVRICRMSHWSEVAIGYSSNGRRLISRKLLPRTSSQSEVDRTLVGRRAKTFLFSSYRASLDGSGTVRSAMCFHGHPGKNRYKRRSRISPRHCKSIRVSRRTFFGHGPIPATMPTCAGTSV